MVNSQITKELWLPGGIGTAKQTVPISPQIKISAKNCWGESFSIFQSEFIGVEAFVCPTNSGFVNELELVGHGRLFTSPCWDMH